MDKLLIELQKAGLSVKDYTALADAVLGIGGSDIQRMNTLIADLQKEPTILNHVRIVQQNAEKIQFERMGFDEDEFILEPFEEGSTATKESKPVLSYDYVMTKEFIGTIPITDRSLEGYHDSQSLLKRLREKAVQKLRRDTARISLRGDTSHSNPTLAYMDGWLKLADAGNTIDAEGNELTLNMLDVALSKLDDRFITPNIAFIMNKKMIKDFGRLVRERATPIGDAFFLGKKQDYYFDMTRLLEASSIPKYIYNDGLDDHECTDILLTDPQNFILAMRRKLSVETERIVKQKRTDWVYHMAMGFKIEEPLACVKIKNVKLKQLSLT